MAAELIFVLGGARSGKSTHAQELALEIGGESVLYVATATPFDDEMRVRIAAHRADRPSGWQTLEAPRETGDAISRAIGEDAGRRVVLVDCLTVLAGNALLDLPEDAPPAEGEAAILRETEGILAAYRASDATWIMVSNEVGLGLVPPYPMGRTYRDALGRANQRVAAAASRVLLMVAGIPLRVK